MLGELLVPDEEVPESFFIPKSQIPQWEYLKGAKREARRAANGHEYFYSEGGSHSPIALDQPSRTILTGEGGSTPRASSTSSRLRAVGSAACTHRA